MTITFKTIMGTVLSAVVAMSATSFAAAQETEFYRGKTIYLVVGYSPGGGYDIYARLLGRHLADHIPGHPTIVVQNMPGAASLTAANYVYSVAPKDGTVIAAIDQNIPLFQLLGGKGVTYDVAKFGWLGSTASSNGIAMTWARTGLRSIEDVKAKGAVTMGTTGNNDDAYIYAKSMDLLLGTKFKLITGYSGTSNVNIAMENGEVEAMGRASYYGFRSQRPDWLADHKVNIIAQFGLEKQPELPAPPLIVDLAQSDQDKQFARLVSIPPTIGYTTWVAPGVPDDRLRALQTAFSQTMIDPAFLDDAKTQNSEVRPKTGDQIKAILKLAESVSIDVRRRATTELGWN